MVKAKEFVFNMLKGGAIGLAIIIPGVSGGTLAVLLGVYDRIIDSISGLFKNFKASITFLLPILLGAVLAFAALYYPLKYALEYAPFPTIMLFAGFMLGSCPDMIKTAKQEGFKKFDVASVIIPLAVVVGICFIPNMGNADLSSAML
ncbi:MAG: undecaprenyl phosphate translocase family protein, partial [Candidatus Coproplasma sp.]